MEQFRVVTTNQRKCPHCDSSSIEVEKVINGNTAMITFSEESVRKANEVLYRCMCCFERFLFVVDK